MAAGVATFGIRDISYLDGKILVNGHVFRASEGLKKKEWTVFDRVTFTLARTAGVYRVDNLNRSSCLFFQLEGTPSSLHERGSVRYLRKMQWKCVIDKIDCGACMDPPPRMQHEKHEVVIPGHGVFVTPASWVFGHQVSLTMDPETGKEYLFNHTLTDGIVLP